MYQSFIGLNDDLPFDTLYTIAIPQMENMDFNFTGYSGSTIASQNNTSIWKIEMLANTGMYATTNGTVPPFGTQEYLLSEDLGGGQIALHLNACNDLHEYNCEDGSCIPIEKRCDSKVDCVDGSDEDTCHMIDVPNYYLSHVPAAGRRFISRRLLHNLA